MDYKIYRYVSPELAQFPTKFPRHIIFPDMLDVYLPRKKYMALGERVKRLYFDPGSDYGEPIIRTTHRFDRDGDGIYLENHNKKIFFTLEDGSWSKDFIEFNIPVTSFDDKEEEIERRRKNIVSELKTLASSMDIRPYMVELFDEYANETYSYVSSGSDKLVKAIESSPISFLNGSLPNGAPAREAILNYLRIGVIKNQQA